MQKNEYIYFSSNCQMLCTKYNNLYRKEKKYIPYKLPRKPKSNCIDDLQKIFDQCWNNIKKLK